ncbi:hypothetical protein K466DRAFT_505520, partial [Polyporus arcularius HHB13444]
QSFPSSMCQFSYVVDAHKDKELFKTQTAFDQFIQREPKFNPENLPRRKWQDGSGDQQQPYFVLTAPVFTKRTQYMWNRAQSQPYEVHQWLKGVSTQSAFFANPDCPKLLELRGTKFVPLSECIPPYLQSGDLFWISLRVEWVVGKSWKMVFTPIEFVRVALVSPVLVGGAVGAPSSSEPGQGDAQGLSVGRDLENGTQIVLVREEV